MPQTALEEAELTESVVGALPEIEQDEKPEESTFNPRKNSDRTYYLSSEELKAIECAF